METDLWPNIIGDGLAGGHDTGKPSNLVTGAFVRNSLISNASHVAGNFDYGKISFNAANSNNIYGASSFVQPKSLTTLYIIKFW